MNRTTPMFVLLFLIILSSAALLKAGTFTDGGTGTSGTHSVTVNSGENTPSASETMLYRDPTDFFLPEMNTGLYEQAATPTAMAESRAMTLVGVVLLLCAVLGAVLAYTD